MTMKDDTASKMVGCGRSTAAQVAWVLAMALTSAIGIVLLALLKPALPWRVLAVLVPLACGVAYARQLVRDMRRLDELQLRINLEAAATACLGAFIAAMVYPVAKLAGFAGQLEAYYVLFLLGGLFVIGYLNASRRYR